LRDDKNIPEAPVMNVKVGSYDVGGVMLDRPFKIRRLGHFALWQSDLEMARRLYVEVLGFRETDTVERDGTAVALFTSHGTDHHSLAAIHPSTAEGIRKAHYENGVLVNQISFQVGTLEEVASAHDYFAQRQVTISRLGRDFPGSNWALYVLDPDGHRIELYYGMEQIGWDRRSKPRAAYLNAVRNGFALPQPAEMTEIIETERSGIDLDSGFRPAEELPSDYCVGGIMLPRPFKVTKIGPVNLFVSDIDRSERFYTELIGLTKTEEVTWRGHRCVYLRCGTDHHCIALFPLALRQELGLKASSTLMSIAVEVATYKQLKDAIPFLREKGLRFIDTIPFELHPGIDYAAHAIGPDGHCIALYHAMEQLGWDGRPRPASQRRRVEGDWPQTLEAAADTYIDQVLQGPLG
jgi:catechol 2,3-dioxygenase-like lactoylglutathione lyase family enzyme